MPPPSFIRPPTPRRVFSGVVGGVGGVYKIWPRMKAFCKEDFHRKGGSVKGSAPFSEPPDFEN